MYNKKSHTTANVTTGYIAVLPVYQNQADSEVGELLIKKTKIKPLGSFSRLLKRCLDVAGALVLMLLSLPMWAYIALRIYLESPEGPIFYAQKRVSRHGKEFTCFKFRSMVVNAEKNGAQWASENDDRVLKYGKIMRKAHYDELPQLWNVLRGDMSLVGPRPERKIFVEMLSDNIEGYQQRHLVKAGLTGWAQVNYPYGDSLDDARRKLDYDLYYLQHWSIWMDILILWKTVFVVLGKKGR